MALTINTERNRIWAKFEEHGAADNRPVRLVISDPSSQLGVQPRLLWLSALCARRECIEIDADRLGLAPQREDALANLAPIDGVENGVAEISVRFAIKIAERVADHLMSLGA